jgi:HSP20 family protein
MYRSYSSRDLFAELGRFQRELHSAFEAAAPTLRSAARGFPALNVEATPSAVEIQAFVPGVEPSGIEVKLEGGLLTIEGERVSAEAGRTEPVIRHLSERFEGRFRRVVQLPDDIDPDAVNAAFRDGVLHVSIARREAPQPRRIDIH